MVEPDEESVGRFIVWHSGSTQHSAGKRHACVYEDRTVAVDLVPDRAEGD
jgi:hypothetical protein